MDVKDFVSSQDHMIEYDEKHHICNNTAHDMLVKRECFLGDVLAKQKTLEVPTIYKVMGAYGLLSALCGPHSTVQANGEYTLNLWTLLIGPSGARKSSAMSPYHTLMGETEALKEIMLPEDATTASYREPLQQSYERSSIGLEMTNPCSSGMIFAQEFGDFVKSDNKDDFASYLVKMWGDQSLVKIGRVTAGDFEIKRPCVSFIGAIQTKLLMKVLPISMWHQGFMPRTIPVYSKQEWKQTTIGHVEWEEGSDIGSDDAEYQKNRFSHMLEDMALECIKLSRSNFICGFDKNGSDLFGEIKLPELPRQLEGYGNRRYEMFRKLCALTAISRAWRTTFKSKETRDKAVKITREDVEIASKLLIWIDSQSHKLVKHAVVSLNEGIYQGLKDLLDENEDKISVKQLNDFCKVQMNPKGAKSFAMEFVLDRSKKFPNMYIEKFILEE